MWLRFSGLTEKKSWLQLFSMGRKRLSENERRDKPLRVRLRPGEREILDFAANEAEMKTSEWVRTVSLKAAQLSRKMGK